MMPAERTPEETITDELVAVAMKNSGRLGRLGWWYVKVFARREKLQHLCAWLTIGFVRGRPYLLEMRAFDE